MLIPPQNGEVLEFRTSTVWFDADGILYSYSKKADPQTLEEMKEVVEQFKRITEGKKFCMIIDVTHTAPSSREVREYAAQELPKLVTALAMISDSALGRMVANLFFALKPAPYPAKICATADEAKKWLKQYL